MIADFFDIIGCALVAAAVIMLLIYGSKNDGQPKIRF